MRKLILLLFILALFSDSHAQNVLLKKIKGEGGLSNQFTKLEGAEQVSFSPGNARKTFGLDGKSDLILIRKETDKSGQTYYRYYQTYLNIPVENSMYLAHTKSGRLTAMGGTIVTQFDSKTDQKNNTSLSSARAITAALNYVHAEKYAWQDADFEQRIKFRKGKSATYYPVPSKVWYGGNDEINPAGLTLAYKIDVYSLKPLDRKFIYVDAKTGKILGTRQEMMHMDAPGTAATGYSGVQPIHSDLNGSTYRLRDLTKGNGIITLHAAGSHADYTSTTADWSFTNADKWALDAHFGVAATWTFYKDVFNRNSVDDAGFALTSWVNDATTPDNAFWDGSEMDYGNLSSNGNGVTAIDVTGHELTHGVTQYTCNLVYSKEPGAMNESISDIMGKSVQFYTKPTDINWTLSNDMNWEIRSFSNPNADGQPDTYKGLNWYSGTADNSGVHTNSGVGNYMFYLLVNGGSGTNDIGNAYTVSGITLAKAQQIIYLTQIKYLTPTSNYAAWRTACINAATEKYGAGSNEVIQVENAWYAVGIGTAGGSSCNLAAPGGIVPGSITNTGATISWNTVAGATGYVLQWKLSSASTFTTVTGITNPSYSLTGLTPGTQYQAQVSTVCSNGGNGAYSAAVSFTTTGTAPVTYCTSVGKTFDGITNVTFNTINNTTSATTSGYTNYTATQSTTVNLGSSYTISIKLNTGGNYKNYAKAWIDWNHDGVFSTTTEEYNLGTATNVTNGTTTLSPLSITVPANAAITTTRMRVSTQYNAAPSPCTASFDGEVEDYSVVVVAGSGCAIPGGLSATAITNTSATLGWTSVAGAVSYNIQYRATGSATWTARTSATNSLAVASLIAGTSYEFQVATVCSGTSTSAYSGSFTFVTTGGAVTYCASKGTSTYEYIKTVVLGTINHTVGNDGGYGNYTSLSTGLAAGTAYTIRVTPGFTGSSYTEAYTVYIDYNHDGFSGTGEVVASGTGTGTAAKSLNFTVPTTAKNGITRLRIQMHYRTLNTNPCATLDFGDVHDYTVNITGGSGFNAPGFATTKAATDVKGMSVFPNPIAGSAAIVSYHLLKEGPVILRVVDVLGRNVQSTYLGSQSKGSHTYQMNHVKELVNGNYFIVLYQDNEVVGRNKVIVTE